MSDTLRERLESVRANVLEQHPHWTSTAAAISEAITELDRLEAEVKKPRLPEGWTVQKTPNGSFWIEGPEVDASDVFRSANSKVISRFLSAFLPTPDMATEPVQAAGDGAGDLLPCPFCGARLS